MNMTPNNMGGFRRVQLCAADSIEQLEVSTIGTACLTLKEGRALFDLPLSDNGASLQATPAASDSGTAWTHRAAVALSWRQSRRDPVALLQLLRHCCLCGCIVIGTDYDGCRLLLGDAVYPLRGTLAETWGATRTALRCWQLELEAVTLHPALVLYD